MQWRQILTQDMKIFVLTSLIDCSANLHQAAIGLGCLGANFCAPFCMSSLQTGCSTTFTSRWRSCTFRALTASHSKERSWWLGPKSIQLGVQHYGPLGQGPLMVGKIAEDKHIFISFIINSFTHTSSQTKKVRGLLSRTHVRQMPQMSSAQAFCLRCQCHSILSGSSKTVGAWTMGL